VYEHLKKKNPCYALGEKHAEHKKSHAQHTKRTELKRNQNYLGWHRGKATAPPFYYE
jgi:hypothetical protein